MIAVFHPSKYNYKTTIGGSDLCSICSFAKRLLSATGVSATGPWRWQYKRIFRLTQGVARLRILTTLSAN